MNATVKNILAVVLGLIIGSAVNMGIIMISSSIIEPPIGADVTTMEGLKESIHLFEPKHFLFPFLAHALGTFAGAFLATLISASHKMKMALLIGIFFLIGGITNIIMLPSPAWFTVLDLAVAYIPMAWLGYKLGKLV
jgi:large-conductance mechanosensitive channel